MDERYLSNLVKQGQSQSAEQQLLRAASLTIRDNLDNRILQAKKQVEELQATKARMEASGILDSHIEDIRQAMNY